MDNKEIEKIMFKMQFEWKRIFGLPITFEKVARFNGITIEIHTNEANHFGSPHCHAKYQDKEISISLRDFSVLVSNGLDAKHQKMAVDYVKENIEQLKALWNHNPNVIQL